VYGWTAETVGKLTLPQMRIYLKNKEDRVETKPVAMQTLGEAQRYLKRKRDEKLETEMLAESEAE